MVLTLDEEDLQSQIEENKRKMHNIFLFFGLTDLG